MSGYDITSILSFNPPRYLCRRCRGFLYQLRSLPVDWGAGRATCPICKAEYVGGEVFDYQMTELSKFLEDEHHAVKFGDVMAHSKRLAELVVQAQGRQYRVPKPWPTMRLLLAALSEAQAFVHFATYGISHQLLGALKLTSMRVPVCGWASMVDSNTRAEMDEYPTETPKFKAKAIASKHWLDAVPHQKLVIIDGLLAFTGSANLTNTGLRHVDRAFDIGAVVTDLDQVRRLNDSYFSNVWATISDRSATENIYISEPF